MEKYNKQEDMKRDRKIRFLVSFLAILFNCTFVARADIENSSAFLAKKEAILAQEVQALKYDIDRYYCTHEKLKNGKMIKTNYYTNFVRKKLQDENTNMDNLKFFLASFSFDEPVGIFSEKLFNEGYFTKDRFFPCQDISKIEKAIREDSLAKFYDTLYSIPELNKGQKERIVLTWFYSGANDRNKIIRILKSKLVPNKHKEEYINIKLKRVTVATPSENITYSDEMNQTNFATENMEKANWGIKSGYLRTKYIFDR